jgi:hypothetical protein
MKLDAAGSQPADAGFGGRFYLVGYLPTYAAAVFLLVLIWAGAPGWARRGHPIRFTTAWTTASHLSLGEVALVALAVALLAVLLQPLQLAMMRMAQGSWPAWPGTRWALRWQEHRRNRLAEAARLPQGPDLADAAIQRAGAAGHALRRRFPRPGHLLQPTALGNVLAAMYDSAGHVYGLDAVTAWPRLYPVLGEQVRALVDDRRDTLDGAVRMASTWPSPPSQLCCCWRARAGGSCWPWCRPGSRCWPTTPPCRPRSPTPRPCTWPSNCTGPTCSPHCGWSRPHGQTPNAT